MKITFIILSLFVFTSLYGQDSQCSRARKELDSDIFNWTLFNKLFEPIKDSGQCIFKTNKNLMLHLENVATFNSCVGSILQNEIIKVHFQFSQSNRVKDASFY